MVYYLHLYKVVSNPNSSPKVTPFICFYYILFPNTVINTFLVLLSRGPINNKLKLISYIYIT